MLTKVANRRSPSGPQVSVQLPFYATEPVTTVTNFAPIGAGAAVAGPLTAPPGAFAQYEIPIGNSLPGANAGNLGVLEVTNNPIAPTDTNSITYEIWKNGAPTGFKTAPIPNNSTATVAVDLSNLAVAKGDLIAIAVNVDAVVIADAPLARLFLTWVPQGNI